MRKVRWKPSERNIIAVTMKSLIHPLIVGICLTGCSMLTSGDDGSVEIPIAELRSAPEFISINGTPLSLRTFMWRDFMPISPPGGKPLIALFQIATSDSSPIPHGLDADAAWVVNGSQVWNTFFEDENPSQPLPYQLERVARDGPKWGPQIEVDAVVRMHEADGTTHLLRATNQTIHRTN